jgi:hypothetical protein
MAHVIYNNIEIFPVPFVTHDVTPLSYGDGRRIGYADKYTIHGLITGINFSQNTGVLNNIYDIFSKDFQTLIFADVGYTGVVSGAKINNISVENSTEVGIFGYTVELLAYPESFFETVGILDKKNEWSVNQSQDGKLTTTHTIFARGVNTAPLYDNAFENAKNFVLTQTGLTIPSLFPFFISGFSGTLDSRAENINRLNGEYTITETYIATTGLPVEKSYTIDITSGNDGIISVDVKGSFKGGKAVSFDTVRQTYSGFDLYSEASGAYVNYRGTTGLVTLPLSSGVTEDFNTNELQFSVTFNDWPTVYYRHIFNTQVTSGIDSVVTASINGRIEGLGRQNVRYDNAYNFYTGLNVIGTIQQAFTDYVGVGYPYPLIVFPISSGNRIDRFVGVIEYNASFNNKTPVLQCTGIKFFEATYNKQYGMRQIAPISIPNSVSGLDAVDLDWNTRSNIEVNGNVVMDKAYTSLDATGAVRQFINGKFRREILSSGSKTKIKLENVSLNQNVNLDSCSFNVNYTFDEPLPIDPNSSYTLITGLTI